MDQLFDFLYILVVLAAWVGGWHTSLRNNRNFVQAYNNLLDQVNGLQERYAKVLDENAQLKGELFAVKAQLDRAEEKIDQLSADLAALNVENGDG